LVKIYGKIEWLLHAGKYLVYNKFPFLSQPSLESMPANSINASITNPLVLNFSSKFLSLDVLIQLILLLFLEKNET